MKNKPVIFIDSIKEHLRLKRKSVCKKDNRRLFILKYVPIAILLCFNFNLIIKLISVVFYWVFVTVFFDHRQITHFKPQISIWFGVPGSGKTSMAAWLTKESIKHHYKVLSNVSIKGAYRLDEEDLGYYDMSFGGDGCHVIYDEATANGLDNRDYKSFSKQKKIYFSTHRHQHNRVDVFSQDYDVDLKIKGRAGENGMFHLSRLPIKGFVMYRCIRKIFFITKEDKQYIDGYEYKGLPRIAFTMPVWKSFDTLDDSLCPKLQKEWLLW